MRLFVWGLSVAYPQSEHTALCGGWVSPRARKIMTALSKLWKFKIWNCRAVMGTDSSPIRIWKAAAIEAESNKSFDQQKKALKLNCIVSPCRWNAPYCRSSLWGYELYNFSLELKLLVSWFVGNHLNVCVSAYWLYIYLMQIWWEWAEILYISQVGYKPRAI